MASLVELGDAAYAHFSRTITWGEELLARLQLANNGRVPEGKVFMIPIRLDDCPIPMRLSQWQVIDYAKPDAKQRILEAVRHAL